MPTLNLRCFAVTLTLILISASIPLWAQGKGKGGGGGENGGGGGETPSAPDYTITFLGTLPNGVESQAHGINNLGDVVGQSDVKVAPGGYGRYAAFLFTEETGMIQVEDLLDPQSVIPVDNTDVSSYNGWVFFEATAINDTGQIVANGKLYTNGIDVNHAVRLTPPADGESYYILEDLGANLTGRAINAAGDVAGFTYGGGSVFLFTDEDGLQDLGRIGGRTTYAHAISNRDTNGNVILAGTVSGGGLPTRAFRYTTADGQFQDLGTLETEQTGSADAFDVNDAGDVVGSADADRKKGNNNEFAFVDLAGAGMFNLGTLSNGRDWNDSCALTINNVGVVVGISMTEHPRIELFYYTLETGMLNLEDSILNLPLYAAGQLQGSSRRLLINDVGAVCGTFNGSTEAPRQAYILRPVLSGR